MVNRALMLLAVLLAAAGGRAAASAGLAPAMQAPAAAPANNGFALAWAVGAFMVIALVYVVVVAVRAGGSGVEDVAGRFETLIPFVAVLGMGVAGYLTFVETRNVAPVCGPVGDCGSVQASPYARLFGVFPVGLLGLFGYIAIIAAWLAGRGGEGRLRDLARVGAFAMAVFGVLFSVYLTYLELFVISAVCIWCLSSAVLITLLMLLTLRPALAVLQPVYYEDEEEAEPA